MDERTMYELLEIYDAKNELEKIEEMLVGIQTAVGYGEGEGILGRLSRVTDIIARNSPMYHPNEDLEESAFWKLLEDSEMNNQKKACILLSGQSR